MNVETRPQTTTRELRRTQLWLLLGVPLYLYANLFAFPNVPFLLNGDQTFFWVYAQRMLRGETVYRDFFQFTPPGLDLVDAVFFRLFGPYLWVTNLIVLLLGVALCWLCFHLARRLMDRDLALLTALLFVVLVYADRLDATHHWFSVFATLCAVRVLMPARTATTIAAAGAILGVASFFTQTVGVAALFALLLALLWERLLTASPWRTLLRRQLLLLLAFALVWSALSAHFIANAGWHRFFYLQVVFPLHYVTYQNQVLIPDPTGPSTLRALPELVQRFSVYLVLIGIYPCVLWDCWRRRHSPTAQDTVQPMLLALTGFSLLLATIARTNWNRLYAIAMPALILLFWAIARARRPRRSITMALWLIIACLALKQTWSKHHHPRPIADLPAGRAALSKQDYEEFSWIAHHTTPGDYFFQSSWLNFYPPLQLRPPVFVDGLWPTEITRPEYVALTAQQIEQKQVKYILWTTRWTGPSQNIAPSEQDHLAPFRAYLTSHYTRVYVFSNQDEIWERK